MPKTTRGTGGGKRYPLNMRTTKETRERLEAAAVANGRSLAQEVEARLDQSFNEAVALGGEGMRRMAFHMIAAFASAGRLRAGGNKNWLDDPSAYRAGFRGVVEALLLGLPDSDEQDLLRELDGAAGTIRAHFARRHQDRNQDNE
jgi:TraY domain